MQNLKTYIKSNTFLYGCVRFARKLFSKYYFEVLFWQICSLLKINKKKIVLCNFYGKGYGDNPKYIAQEIISQDLNYDLVWLLDDNFKESIFPKEIRVVRYGSFKAIYEMATAKLWIDDCRKVYYTKKRKNQYYIQTWH
jgi:CDP-glycerol glycerophosphotransferase